MSSVLDLALSERVLALAMTIQQIPAPTFSEARRAAFIFERFQAEGLSDISMDAIGNVYGRLPGAGSMPPLVVSAHLDTVFPEDTPLDCRREAETIYGPGIGDNALGVAGLFGLLWGVKEIVSPRLQPNLSGPKAKSSLALPGDLWLVANVTEEGMGNLLGMTAVVDRFGGDARAYLILEGMALGQVYHRGLNVRRYQISASTAGGHSWVDYGQPSAIHELAGLITRLSALSLPSQPRTTLNVGVISGGTTVNSIAAEANCLLDLRSEGHESMVNLATEVEGLIDAGNRNGVQFSWEVVGQRPAGEMPRDHPLVQLAASCLESQGIQPLFNIGSTDANLPLSRGLPAICIGLTTGGGAHTTGEYIHTQPLSQGLAQLFMFVEAVFNGW